MNLSMKQTEHTDRTDLVVVKGEGWSGRLGLADVNFHIQNE